MTGKERIFRTLQGLDVDRPAVNFYEINGFTQNPHDLDRFNIYNDSSWLPLLQLAREKTDSITTLDVPVKRDGKVLGVIPQSLINSYKNETTSQRHFFTTINTPQRVLKSEYMTAADVDTSWCLEHLLKDADDLAAWVALPEEELRGEVDAEYFLRIEQKIGDAGVAMIDTLDPLCLIAYMLPMEEFTIIAMTEQELFHRALEKAARFLYWRTSLIAGKLPGRLWRIYGPEYATPPYLPPNLFHSHPIGF